MNQTTSRVVTAVLVVAVLAAAYFLGHRVGLPADVAALNYVNRRERFAMNVPPAWSIREQPGRPQAFLLGPESAANGRPTVNVVVDTSEHARSQAEWEAGNRLLLKTLDQFQLVAETPRILAGGQAVTVFTYRHRVQGREIVQRQLGLVSGRTIYVVTASAESGAWAANEANFELCLASFRAAW